MGYYLKKLDDGPVSREELTSLLLKHRININEIHAFLYYVYNAEYHMLNMERQYKAWFTNTSGLRVQCRKLDINITVGLMYFLVLFESERNTKKEPIKYKVLNRNFDKNWQEVLCRFINQPQVYTDNKEYLKLKDPLAFYRALAFEFETEGIALDKYLEDFELDVDKEEFINGMDDHCIIMKSHKGLVWNCKYIKEAIRKMDYSRVIWARMSSDLARRKINRFR